MKEEVLANCAYFITRRRELRCVYHALERIAIAFAEPGRFRPRRRLTFRFRVLPPGEASSSGAPCSAQRGIYAAGGTGIKVRAR